jgi:energy-coupling factor transport system substrate-specific component
MPPKRNDCFQSLLAYGWIIQPVLPKSREVAFASTFIAVGAASRIMFGNVALESPGPLYGILIKVGLSETLAIVNGLAIGPVAGFITGALIVLVSDLFMVPGPWTPFIALIIGLLGLLSGIVRRWFTNPTAPRLALLAVSLTLLSEVLQNAWVSLFYGVPFLATAIMGVPSIVTALINNAILLSLLGPRIVMLIRKTT